MKKWLYTLVTKSVWQSINTPQCYDNTKLDQILIILWQCSWVIEHTVVIVINELKAVKWMNMVNTTWSKVELFTLFI